ncbi:MAG: hypothetical protein RJB01_1200 [Actinomycetota bacterium]
MDARIKDFWKDLPPAQRSALVKTREAIAAALPGAGVEISWGMPTFRVGKDIVISLTGFKEHNSLFPGSVVASLLTTELAAYTVTKGTIHFAKDKPFPTPLLKKILKARIAQINESYPRSTGQVFEYYDNGYTKASGKVKNGELHGNWKWFRRDGSLMRSGSFTNGEQSGKWTTYTADGAVVKVTNF